MRDAIASWVLGYVQAWTSNDPADIGALFSDDARYFTAPFREPWTGREGIVAEWLARRDEPGSWGFRFEILGVEDDVGFVRGWTEYKDDPDYSNLWVIRLDPAGQCTEFTEWWMVEEGSGA